MKFNRLIILFVFAFNSLFFAQSTIDKFNYALKAYDNNDYVKAYSLFSEFINEYKMADELYSTAKFYSAESMLKLGQYDVAASEYSFFLKNYKWSSHRETALYRLSLIYYNNQEYLSSRELIEELLQKYPGSKYLSEVLFLKGESYLYENKPEEAIADFKKAINRSNTTKHLDRLYFSMAYAYEKKGDFQNALRYYDTVLTYRNSELKYQAQIRIGLNYFKLKDYQSTIVELNNPILSNLPKEKYAESLYLLAHSYYRVQEFDNAEKIYREIVADFNNSDLVRDAQYGIAWSLFQQEKYEDAFSVYDELSKTGNDSISINSAYWKGEAKRYQGQIDEADDIFSLFIQNYSSSPLFYNANIQLGYIYYIKNNLPAAEEYFLTAMKSSDNNVKVKAQLYLAEVRSKKGFYLDAAGFYKEALNIASVSDELKYQALYGLGISQFKMKEYENSIKTLKDLQSRNKGFLSNNVNYYLAEDYFNSGNYEEALNFYNTIETEDEILQSKVVLGKAYSMLNLKEFETAGTLFNEFITSNSGSPLVFDAKIRLADSYHGLKDYNAASRIYNDLQKGSDIKDPYANFQYGQVLFKLNKFDDALKVLEGIERNYPRSEYAPKAAYFIGWMYFSKENYNEAIKRYNIVLSNYPNSNIAPQVYYSIGDAYYNASNFDSSIIYYQRILSDYPGSNFVLDAIQGMQDSYAALGMTDKAAAHIEGFLKQNNTFNKADQLSFKRNEILYNSNNYELAKEGFHEFVTTYSNSSFTPGAYYFLANSNFKLNDTIEGVKNLNTLLDKYSSSSSAYDAAIQLSEFYLTHKNYDSAIIAFDKVINNQAANERKAEIYYLKGSALVEANKLELAIPVFVYLMQNFDQNIYADKAMFELALIDYVGGRYEIPEKYFRRLGDIRDDELGANSQFNLGMTYYDQKKYDEAIEAFEKVKTKFSQYDEWLTKTNMQLGDYYYSIKNYEKAKEHYTDVLNAHKKDVYGRDAKKKLDLMK